MEFFKKNTQINFMKQRRFAALFSIFLFVVSISALGIRGLNFGLDFTGGTQLELQFPAAVNLQEIREALIKHDLEAVVQSYGTSQDVLVSLPPQESRAGDAGTVLSEQDQLKRKVLEIFDQAQLVQVEYIGPQVGGELASKGLLAVVAALIATMAYIALRFEYRFAVSAAIALIHDPVLILGLFALFQWTFDLNVLAALLAVIGYSLNDTIVVYDRIRENFRSTRNTNVEEVVNASINQTLSRTIMTSVLTLLVVVSLFIFGGQVIRGFASALMIGIVIGTYSSIYIAGSLAVQFGLKREALLPKAKKAQNEHGVV